MPRSKGKTPPPAIPYQPTGREARTGLAAVDRAERTIPAPKVTLIHKEGQAPDLKIEHADTAAGQVLLSEALGIAEWDLTWDILKQLMMMFTTKGDPSTYSALYSSLETVKGIRPRDETEALMAVQMTAVHRLLLQWVAKTRTMNTMEQLETADRAVNRLARTYAAQMEALKRYRSSGQQKVTVEHVNVHAGGKAVVGNVSAR